MNGTKKIASLLALVLALSAFFAIPAVAADVEIGKAPALQSLIYEYVAAIGNQDFKTQIDMLAEPFKSDRQSLMNSGQAKKESIGLYNVTGAEVVSIEEVDIYRSRYVFDLLERSDNVRSFLVGVNLDVKQDDIFTFGGLNFYLITLIQESGEWLITEMSMADLDTVNSVFKNPTGDVKTAINVIEARYRGIWMNNEGQVMQRDATASESAVAESGISTVTAAADQFARPGDIKVWMKTGYSLTVDLYTYCKSVLYTEWGVNNLTTGVAHPMAALEAGAQCVKMRVWYNYYNQATWTNGCHVSNAIDGNYQPGYEHERSTQAINNVGGIGIKSYNGNVMNTYFMASPTGSSGYHGGICGQNGSIWLANNYGYTWQDIIHYYFDNATNVCPGGPCSWFYY